MNPILIENIAQARIAEMIAEADAHRRARALRPPRRRSSRSAGNRSLAALAHRPSTRTDGGRRVTKSLPSS